MFGEQMLDARTGQPLNMQQLNQPMMEPVYQMGPGGALVMRASDPLFPAATYNTPVDFAAQFPTPINPTEIVAMCEEVSMLSWLPSIGTGLKLETWRELNALAFTGGNANIAFGDGLCPEEYYHDGSNQTITLKNVGASKSLTLSDILHSRAVAQYGAPIRRLVGPVPAFQGMPGETGGDTGLPGTVADVKEKEMRLATTLVYNGLDRLSVAGNATSRPLEFDGLENYFTNNSLTPHTNTNTASGSFDAAGFDQFLGEGCAMPTALAGHPSAMQGLMMAYFALGFNGSQLIHFQNGNRVTPGFNFASAVNTAIGQLEVIADRNFAKTNIGGATAKFQSKIYGLRMSQNGEPLVYMSTQIPISFHDMYPGCTAIRFIIWGKMALVIKHACAHHIYTTQFTGNIVTTCPTIG